MSKYLIIIFVLFSATYGLSQITTRREWDSAKEKYKIIVQNDYPNHRVIRLTFDYIKGNCRNGNKSFEKTVRPGESTLTTITAINGMRKSRPEFRYKLVSYTGRNDKKPNLDFPYLIPIKPGKQTEINKHNYLGQKYGNFDPPKDWYSLTLKTTSGDTIYAARQGVVGNVKDNQISEDQKEVHYQRSKNSVTIQHKDGTTARYELFVNNGIFPEVGDFVYAGDPIGIIGGEYYDSGSHLNFSVYYYNYYPKTSDGKDTGEYYSNAYVPVNFYSVDGVLKFEHCHTVIESVHDESIITSEMSKKQKKKWKKRNGK